MGRDCCIRAGRLEQVLRLSAGRVRSCAPEIDTNMVKCRNEPKLTTTYEDAPSSLRPVHSRLLRVVSREERAPFRLVVVGVLLLELNASVTLLASAMDAAVMANTTTAQAACMAVRQAQGE